MSESSLLLPDEAAEALQVLQEHSKRTPVIVFKKSPICPISSNAEKEFRSWLDAGGKDQAAVSWVDVINQRPLARGLTELLGIRHESPQALLFRDGECVWNDSHQKLTSQQFTALF